MTAPLLGWRLAQTWTRAERGWVASIAWASDTDWYILRIKRDGGTDYATTKTRTLAEAMELAEEHFRSIGGARKAA